MGSYEQGRARLAELVQVAKNNRNEATTRLHLIDMLLFECLGWEKVACISEERFDGRYVDYTLGRPSRKLLLEAKREGTSFELPAGFTEFTCTFKTLFESSAGIEAAIRQVAGYAQERGVPVAVVSNGHQLIAFLASRQDGIAPLEGRALVFHSLRDMHDRFRVIWDNLSEVGVDAYTLHETLKHRETPPPPEKLSQRIIRYPGNKNRDEIQTNLKILGDLFLEDLPQSEELEDEFLKDAYCASGALSQHALIGKEILRTTYAALESETDARLEAVATKKGLSKSFPADLVAATATSRPIILLGDVGVGKTVFIRHFIRIDAKDVLDRSIVLYVDYGRKATLLEDELGSFLVGEIARQLEDGYGIDINEDGFVRGVYHSALARFTKGVYKRLAISSPQDYELKEIEFLAEKLKDEREHLSASIKHLHKAERKQIVVFLDNIDQRSSAFQERVFIAAQELASSWPAAVFVSIRPDTFHRSRLRGSLTAYQPRAFTVAPPRIELVIEKRLRFALRELSGRGAAGPLPQAITLQSEALNADLKALLASLERPELVELLENLGGGNVRIALELIQTFIGSPHVDTKRIVDAFDQGGQFIVPLHEFLRSIIYGDHQYFYPPASRIVNLFDISTRDGREHFLLPLVLGLSERLGQLEGDQGFVAAERLYEECQALGFHPTQVGFAIRRALEGRLLQPSLAAEASDDRRRYRLTTVGAYTYKRLPSLFTYVDAMIIDTPIVDESYRDKIEDVWPLARRAERMGHFLGYLDQQWKPLGERTMTLEWPRHSQKVLAEAERLQRASLSKKPEMTEPAHEERNRTS